MRTITIMFMLTLLIGCGEQSVVPMTDAGVIGDGSIQEDADAAEEADAGDRDSSTPDAGTPDSGTRPDAGRDSGTDSGMPDAGTPDSSTPGDAGTDSSVPDAGTDAAVDAGPPRPVGAAVDVSGSRCALDSAGSVWCWGRWTPVEDVRLMGAGFDSVSGSCALRGSEVWCAEFTTETMVPVIEGSATLEVDTISEYSDLARGCGHRLTPEGWGEAVCWADGGSAAREGGTGATLVAVSATSPREVSAIGGTWEAYDVNPPSTCRSDGTLVSCVRDTGGRHWLLRPTGDHYTLGFGMSCAHNAGMTTCNAGGSSWSITDDGTFHDQSVSWPIGTWSTVGGVPRYHEARGICISGNTLRCYDGRGTLAYTVNW